MKDFINKKTRIVFWQVKGKVISTEKFSETHVNSTGGGHPESPPNIYSRAVTNHEFWIKTKDGKEEGITIKGKDIPLRQDQEITLVSIGRSGAKTGYYCFIVNHSAGKHWFLTNADELTDLFGFKADSGESFIIAGAIWWAISYFTEIGLGFWAAFAFLVFNLIQKSTRKSEFKKGLDAHLRSLIQDTYKKNHKNT